MQNSQTKKVYLAIFYILCLVAAVSFVAYHLFNLLNSDIVTVRAEEKHVKDMSSYIGYLVRDEKTVALPQGSVLPSGKNGTKFKKGDVCASVYPSDKQEILDRIAALEKESAVLKKALYYSSLDQSTSEAALKYKELMDKLSQGNAAVGESADALWGAQLSVDYVFDRASIREANQKVLDEIEDLRASLGGKVGEISMPEGGYFFMGGDSFGNVFAGSLAENATADEIFSAVEEYENANHSDTSFVTFTDVPKCYIIIPTDLEEAKKYDKNNIYTLLLGENESETKAYLADVRNASDGKRACLVFSLSDVVAGFDYSRSFEVKAVADEYDCYRIPFSALRSSRDGTKGVYVLSGGVVVFRRVEIIESRESYVLVKSYKNYISDLESGKNASGIYNSNKKDSLFTGIYPGGPYSFFEKSEDLLNTKLNISDVLGGSTIDISSDDENFEYSYLEENEYVIIGGSSLYHGKIPG